MRNYSVSQNILAIAPGLTIKDQIKSSHMTKKEFARRMGFTPEHVSRLLSGQVELTRETAEKLELVLGPPAYFWNNLESEYREAIQKIEDEKSENQLAIFPINKMVDNNYIEIDEDTNLLKSLKSFFHVTNLNLIDPNFYKIENANLESKENIEKLCWVQSIFNLALQIWTETFYKKNTAKIASIIENYNNSSEKDFEELQSQLSDFGVALVYSKPLSGQDYNPVISRQRGQVIIGVSDTNIIPIFAF